MSSDHPGPAAPATPPERPRRRWTLALVLLAVVATLSPVVWLASRPAPDAGLPLAEALAAEPTDDTGRETVGSLAETDPDAAGTTPGSSVDSGAGDGDEAPVDTPGTAAPSADQPPSPRPFGEVAVRDASVDALATGAVAAPRRLVVPAMGIDAPVDGVGVEPDGSMSIPDDVARVGWYRFGAAPGSVGNTVLAGHVDGADQGPGVLFRLRGVEVGTRLTLVDETGTDHVYEVVGRERITKAVLPVEQIFARAGEHRLVVITCGGEFLPELRSYSDNVVVTAVPVAPA